MLTEDFIQDLIVCPKKAVKAERKRMLSVNRSLRNRVALISLDGSYTYDLFLRQSEDFLEDFSVGLIWTNADKHIGVNKQIILIRLQGPHDTGEPLGKDLHHDYHVHKITVADINERRYLRPSSKESSKKFSSFAGALFHISEYCDITGLDKYIDLPQANEPSPDQISLFE